MTVTKPLNLKAWLEGLPGVASVDDVRVEGGFVQHVSLVTEQAGRLEADQLKPSDGDDLYDFYHRLSERSRRLFVPYPLFHARPASGQDLAGRIKAWRDEHDWSAIVLRQGKMVIGFGLLKRIKSASATSAIVVAEECRGRGLGYLLQTVLIGQARLLGLRRFHVKVVSDNTASVRLHEKCGFIKTRVIHNHPYADMLDYLNQNDEKNGVIVTDRQIIEMVIDLDEAVTRRNEKNVKVKTDRAG